MARTAETLNTGRTDEDVAGRDHLPTPGTYDIDVTHSTVAFVARHLVGSKVRGRFSDFSGVITIADPVEESSVEAVVNAASVDTGVAQRDEHLRTSDFLELETYPTLTLKSTALTPAGGNRWILRSDLTIHGVTRPVEFDLEFLGSGPGMAPGSEVAAFEATADIDRRDYGVSFSAALDNGGLVVGNKVRIQLEVEAARR